MFRFNGLSDLSVQPAAAIHSLNVLFSLAANDSKSVSYMLELISAPI